MFEAIEVQGVSHDLLYNVKQLQGMIPISRSHLYKSLKRYNVPCVLIGRSRVYLGSDILTFIKKMRTESGDVLDSNSPKQAG